MVGPDCVLIRKTKIVIIRQIGQTNRDRSLINTQHHVFQQQRTPVRMILLDNYVQLDYLSSNDKLKNYDKDQDWVLDSFQYHHSVSMYPSMYPNKLKKHCDDKNEKSYKSRSIDSFQFLYGNCFSEQNSATKLILLNTIKLLQEKPCFKISQRKNLQFSKLYVIFGAILQLSKFPTVSQNQARLTGIGYKE